MPVRLGPQLLPVCSRGWAVIIRWPQNESVAFPRRGKDVDLSGFNQDNNRRRPARLGIRQRKRGHNMSPGLEDAAVMLVTRNLGHLFSIDQQSDRQIRSEVRRPLHNHSPGRSTRGRTRSRFSEKSRERLRVINPNNKHRAPDRQGDVKTPIHLTRKV